MTTTVYAKKLCSNFALSKSKGWGRPMRLTSVHRHTDTNKTRQYGGKHEKVMVLRDTQDHYYTKDYVSHPCGLLCDVTHSELVLVPESIDGVFIAQDVLDGSVK